VDAIAILPTYNEAENIEKIIKEILSCGVDIEVLVADDMSPDGTYKIVEEISKTNPKVQLLLRKENRGRGHAGKEAFKKALETDAKYIVEMDADGSHSPKYIPLFRKAIENCGVVIGSRYVQGGKDGRRSFLRRLISALSRFYLNLVLGLKLKDPTSGFRMFRREAAETFVDKLSAPDPFIVSEVLYYLKKNKIKIEECPIEFLPRTAGRSKLRPFTLIKYLFRVLKLRFR